MKLKKTVSAKCKEYRKLINKIKNAKKLKN